MTDVMIQWIVGQVGTGGIAALALIMLREAYKAQTADRDILIKTLQANTEALARLESAVDRMTATVGGCEDAQKAARERR